MKDEQLFRAKFDEIIRDTWNYYKPQERERQDLLRFMNKVLNELDTDIKEPNVQTVIDDYQKHLDIHVSHLQKLKDDLHPFNPRAKATHHTPKTKIESDLYFYSGMVKIESFVIDYLKSKQNNQTISQKKIPAKYYALLHWIKIKSHTEFAFEMNEFDLFPKEEIKEFAKKNYKGIDYEGFYRHYTKINIKDKDSIRREFGRGYKKIIAEISNNDQEVIKTLKQFPD